MTELDPALAVAFDLIEEREALQAENRRLLAAMSTIQTVKEDHVLEMVCGRNWDHYCTEPPERAQCREDQLDWPCPTVRLLAELEARDAGVATRNGLIEELSTALEQTVEGLHREAHSIYSSWRVCDDFRCRRANELI